MSRKRVKSECHRKNAEKVCQVRVSHKSVKQRCLTRVLRNSVKQECPTRVSNQCLMSGRTATMSMCIAFLPQHTCQHSGLWASSCFLRHGCSMLRIFRGAMQNYRRGNKTTYPNIFIIIGVFILIGVFTKMGITMNHCFLRLGNLSFEACIAKPQWLGCSPWSCRSSSRHILVTATWNMPVSTHQFSNGFRTWLHHFSWKMIKYPGWIVASDILWIPSIVAALCT